MHEETTRTVRVTVTQVEDTFAAHATVVAGPGTPRGGESGIRRTAEVALMEAFAKLVGSLARPEEVASNVLEGDWFTRSPTPGGGGSVPADPADPSEPAVAAGPAGTTGAPGSAGPGGE